MDAAKVIGMADPFTADAFYESAQDFALRALEAHHTGDHRYVPLFAGTAIEHLAKACLARRSPALLVEMTRGRSDFKSTIALLRLEGAPVPASIRTVGLTEALDRMKDFIKSEVDKNDLQTLVDMRNGVVHAAQENEVEERILTAFVQQADALLADFGRERADFWKTQLSVVNALVTGASDKLRLRVQMKIAKAEAMIDRLYETQGEAVLRTLRMLSRGLLGDMERYRDCPVCASDALAVGELDSTPDGLWFSAQTIHCRVCNLRLDSVAEIEAAGIEPRWQTETVLWDDYEQTSDDEDAAYERSREEREGL